MDSKKRVTLPEQRPESRAAVPLEVQLEIAKQNQKLAELRYRNLVRRGKAWRVRQEPENAPN